VTIAAATSTADAVAVAAERRRSRSDPSRARRRTDRIADIGGRAVIVALFTLLAMRLGNDFAETGRVTGLLLLLSESLVVVLTVFRRSAAWIDRSWRARLITGLSMLGPLALRPAPHAALAPEALTVSVSAIGLCIVVVGKLSLGRSFGLMPANRGVVSTGMYRLVRHPIYAGYLLSHAAFACAHATPWNLALLFSADLALLVRAVLEERTLALDDAYLAYRQKVHWRVLPGVF
jgi:protein-S-isoprenylcysteine O-methyltransferase Ste14